MKPRFTRISEDAIKVLMVRAYMMGRRIKPFCSPQEFDERVIKELERLKWDY